MSRERIDKLLVDRGLVRSRKRAQARIMAGDVRINDQVVDKAGTRVPIDAEIKLVGEEIPFVSRGGLKLEQALDTFRVEVAGLTCMDVGASTGGFTDCLLQRGAKRVYAVDVGYGQLAWKLRNDERVTVLERTNIRHLEPVSVPDLIELAVIDCSFIGLDKVLPATSRFLGDGASVVALVKPQFEAGRAGVGKGGVVRDPRVRNRTIAAVRAVSEDIGFTVDDGVDCDTHGPSGNVEYLLKLTWRDS